MVETVSVVAGVLGMFRLVTFGLTLGITLVSFRAYRAKQSDSLQAAFIGFAFVSMGVAMSTVITRLGITTIESRVVVLSLQLSETVPFLIGFSMLYWSLYR